MPKKRDVLAALTRDELSEAVERFELTSDDAGSRISLSRLLPPPTRPHSRRYWKRSRGTG